MNKKNFSTWCHSLLMALGLFFTPGLSSLVKAATEMPPLQWSIHTSQTKLTKLSGDTLRVDIVIPKGWHITSHQPKSEFLIPLVATIESPSLKFNAAVYPKPTIKPMPALGFDGSYFENTLQLKFPVTLNPKTNSWSSVKINLDYQACTDAMCLPPTSAEKSFSASEIAKTHLAPIAKNQIAPISVSSMASTEVNSSSSPALADTQKIDSTPKVIATATVAAEQKISESPLPKAEDDSSPLVWLKYLCLAFIGGLILNLMPCVLPVLGLKVFALVQKQNHSRIGLLKHAGAFLAGTLLSFWVLALAMIILKKAGQQIGWGFQFQNIEFVLFMAFLVAVFALNLLGMFEVSLGWKTQTKLDGAARKDGLLGAFFNGAFMTLLATPCTAPMLSPAMGFAFSKPDSVLVLFMTFVACGLALPYVAVCVFPQAIRFFPKPGNWMISLKEFMGYLMLLTLVWLLYTLGQMGGNYALSLVLVLIIFIPMIIWLWKILPWTKYGKPVWKKALTAIVLGGLWFGYGIQSLLLPAIDAHKSESRIQKQELIELQKGNASTTSTNYYRKAFSKELIEKLNKQGMDVFVDFTADWCITCHVNEKVALSPTEVHNKFLANKPVFLIGDYTDKDSLITQELKRFGRSGVPMYVIYKADGSTKVLPEIITAQTVLDGIK